MKLKKRFGIGVATIAVALAFFALAYNQCWSPRARVKAAVERASKELSERNVPAVLDLVADDFEQGGLDKPKLAESLRMFYAEFDRVKVSLGEHKVSVSGETAVDSIKAVVVVSKGGQQGYLLGQFGNPAGLAIKLKRRGRWLITGVDGMPAY